MNIDLDKQAVRLIIDARDSHNQVEDDQDEIDEIIRVRKLIEETARHNNDYRLTGVLRDWS